jgi:Leucine-rich repeat (LRR) protein
MLPLRVEYLFFNRTKNTGSNNHYPCVCERERESARARERERETAVCERVCIVPQIFSQLTLILLTKCRTLNLFNNFLIKLPKQLSNLKELVEFNAGDNKIKTTPKFENMSSLIRLALFHHTIVSMQPLENLHTVQKLDFSKNQIDNFPNMGAFPKMVELLASNNRFTVLPEYIGKHSNLQMFEAAHNKLNTIPASISQISKLWKLMLSENKLAALPPELFSLPLRTLDLTRNQFAMFPDELPKLSQTLVNNIFKYTSTTFDVVEVYLKTDEGLR